MYEIDFSFARYTYYQYMYEGSGTRGAIFFASLPNFATFIHILSN